MTWDSLIIAAAIIAHALLTKGFNMAALDDKIAALKAAVANEKTVHDSLRVFIAGLKQQLTDALAAAASAGATPEQLQAIQDATDALTSEQNDFATLAVTNTPAAPTPTPDAPANP